MSFNDITEYDLDEDYPATTTADHLTTENELLFYSTFSPQPLPYHGDSFWAFHSSYVSVHGYLALIICAFGIPFNLMNIIVLTRRSMITPINILLTALAIVDTLVLVTYIPFAIHQYILRGFVTIVEWRSYAWMAFNHFNIHFTIICHTVAVWLTITVAVFRFVAVEFPLKAATYCSMSRAVIAVAVAWVATVILCIPSYLSTEIGIVEDAHLVHHMHDLGYNVTMYRIDESEFSRQNNHMPRMVSFYAFSVFAKLLPCVVLIVFSVLLVLSIKSDRPVVLPDPLSLTGTHGVSIEMNPFRDDNRKPDVFYHAGRSDGRDRITPMIVAVLVFFLITELPSGIVALISGFSHDFFSNVYVPLGDLMDILALMNCLVHFIIYVSFSWQFRETFRGVFLKCQRR